MTEFSRATMGTKCRCPSVWLSQCVRRGRSRPGNVQYQGTSPSCQRPVSSHHWAGRATHVPRPGGVLSASGRPCRGHSANRETALLVIIVKTLHPASERGAPLVITEGCLALKRPEAQRGRVLVRGHTAGGTGRTIALLGSRKVNIVGFPFLFNPSPSRTNFELL